jgi:hypothetical protein
VKGLKKLGDRFDDLPAEAIAPNTMASLFNTFDQMVENGMGGWAELIGLDAVLKQLEDQNGTEERG